MAEKDIGISKNIDCRAIYAQHIRGQRNASSLVLLKHLFVFCICDCRSRIELGTVIMILPSVCHFSIHLINKYYHLVYFILGNLETLCELPNLSLWENGPNTTGILGKCLICFKK